MKQTKNLIIIPKIFQHRYITKVTSSKSSNWLISQAKNSPFDYILVPLFHYFIQEPKLVFKLLRELRLPYPDMTDLVPPPKPLSSSSFSKILRQKYQSKQIRITIKIIKYLSLKPVKSSHPILPLSPFGHNIAFIFQGLHINAGIIALSYKQMLESDFAGLDNLHIDQEEIRPRMRSYHIRIKQRKSDLEDYQLKQTIGQGGFGKVKKAIHKMTGETVAVKITTLESYDVDQIEAIQRQIELQKNLMHENIAQIYEVIKRENKIYIFMEFCKNGELFDKINKTGPMPEKEAARIFHQILSALLYLKESGLSHRDIKPENVLFDDHWNVKLIDFGFSCTANFGEFRKTICGTPSYTAPEIIKRQTYDPQLVDVWCLGVTLYAMLAAQLPFEGETPQERKAHIVAFKYSPQSVFTNKAQKLFASIFVDAKHRVRLWELRTSEFSLAYEPTRAHFIDFRNENIIVEDTIVDILDKEYHIDPQRVVESVKSCRFDKYHAMYYLTLKNQKHTHRHTQQNNLDQYKKQRKGSLVKLDPITRTPTVPKNNIDRERTHHTLTLKTSRVEKDGVVRMKPRKGNSDPSTCRLRKDSPDSPRRLLDCLAAYKEF